MLNFAKLFGFNSSGVPKGVRVNASDQIQIAVNDDGGAITIDDGGSSITVDGTITTNIGTDQWVFLVGVAVPSSEGVLLDGSASLDNSGSSIYEVAFNVVSIDASNAVVVSIGRDDAAGGSLAGAEYWMFSETVPAGGSSGWRGPFLMSGDDDVRGVAGAANDAVIQWRVRKLA